MKPRVFIPAVIVSAITWSGGYVIAGNFLGPYWELVAAKLGGIERVVLLAVLVAIAILIRRTIFRKPRHEGA